VSIAPNYWEELNDLENSEDRRSVGRHGNQHVRLRSAQVEKRSARLDRQCWLRAVAGVLSTISKKATSKHRADAGLSARANQNTAI
jgi:hypothetical protein